MDLDNVLPDCPHIGSSSSRPRSAMWIQAKFIKKYPCVVKWRYKGIWTTKQRLVFVADGYINKPNNTCMKHDKRRSNVTLCVMF